VWWPVALLLWLTTLAAILLVIRRWSGANPLLAGILALEWAWSGAVYHLVFFRPINPAAMAFGLLFLAEAALLLWLGVLRRRLDFSPGPAIRSRVGIGLMCYAAIYPVLGLVAGLRYPALPTFAVPCPTTILTAGGLLLVPRSAARLPAIIPVAWSAIGGSAAFLLGMRADLALPLAGTLLLFHILIPDTRPRPDRD
jgi:hypothetical protein